MKIVKLFTELFSVKNQNSLRYSNRETISGKYNEIESSENEQIDGTPFAICKNHIDDSDPWILGFGNYKLKTGKTKKELKDYLITNRYNIMCDMIIIINEVKEKHTVK